MSELGENARVLTGGTDLLVQMKLKIEKWMHGISVVRVPGMDQITPSNRHSVSIGPTVTIAACLEIFRQPGSPTHTWSKN